MHKKAGQHYPYSAVAGNNTQNKLLSFISQLFENHQHIIHLSSAINHSSPLPLLLCNTCRKTKCAPLHSLHFPTWQKNKINFILLKLICKAQSCRTWSGNTNLILPGTFSRWLGQGLPSPPHSSPKGTSEILHVCGTPKIRMRSVHHTHQRNLHPQNQDSYFTITDTSLQPSS